MVDPTGRTGPHPDLRELFCAALNESNAARPDHRDQEGSSVTPDRLEIACQRTWHGIDSYSPLFDGASASACVVRVQNEPESHSYFFEALRSPESEVWQWSGMSGGPRPPHPDGRPHHEGGTLISWDHSVCAGGLSYFPEMHSLQLELADGSMFEDTFADGCAILFASFQSDDVFAGEAAVRFLDADGNILVEDRVPVGGDPPGFQRPTVS